MNALKRVKNKYNLVVISILAALISLLLLYATYKNMQLTKKFSVTKLTPTITPATNQTNEEIILDSPNSGDEITSPLKITGQARGSWFFEATFPLVLTDWDGNIIAQSFATAEGEWMTTEFVPFTATLEFIKPAYGQNGNLILQKANPSGLPENDKALEIVVFFE